jgi:hypothetical protein
MNVLDIPSLHLKLHSRGGRGGAQCPRSESAVEGPALLHRRTAAREGLPSDETAQLRHGQCSATVLCGVIWKSRGIERLDVAALGWKFVRDGKTALVWIKRSY